MAALVTAALDISLADGRFVPDVLEVAVRRCVAAWVEAVDGDDRRLWSIAQRPALRELLHAGDPRARTRVVVRGLQVRRITIISVHAATKPPSVTLDLEFSGTRYLEDRDTQAA
jgi:hypothetical protein